MVWTAISGPASGGPQPSTAQCGQLGGDRPTSAAAKRAAIGVFVQPARTGCVDDHRRLLRQEVGYIHLDPRGAELLFQIITAREERASIACASNAPFSEWGATFTDPRLAAAVVDRLTFNAHIINTGTNSYRLRTTRTNRKAAATRPT